MLVNVYPFEDESKTADVVAHILLGRHRSNEYGLSALLVAPAPTLQQHMPTGAKVAAASVRGRPEMLQRQRQPYPLLSAAYPT